MCVAIVAVCERGVERIESNFVVVRVSRFVLQNDTHSIVRTAAL
jgi:hypothetical protein